MEWLANLSVKWVLVAVGALVLALTLFRMTWDQRDQNWVWIIENIQVVLSVVVVVFLIIRPFLFQAFYIPSGSMEPTLLGPEGSSGAGDRLLVNKLIYRFVSPRRGDIVVFHAPPNVGGDLLGSREERLRRNDPTEGKEFIKRVMGEPGETISVAPPRIMVDDKRAVTLTRGGGWKSGDFVSGMDADEEREPKVEAGGKRAQIFTLEEGGVKVLAVSDLEVRGLPYRVEVDGQVLLDSPDGRIKELEDVGRYGAEPSVVGRTFHLEEDNNGTRSDPNLILVKGRKLAYRPGEVMINGKPVKDYTPVRPYYSMSPVELGPNEYFMMGDNRNNSNDSHAWGPLTRDRVIGRAEIIFWPLPRFKVMEWWLIAALVIIFGAYEMLQRLLRSGHEHPAK
jgi:signal peptidase I